MGQTVATGFKEPSYSLSFVEMSDHTCHLKSPFIRRQICGEALNRSPSVGNTGPSGTPGTEKGQRTLVATRPHISVAAASHGIHLHRGEERQLPGPNQIVLLYHTGYRLWTGPQETTLLHPGTPVHPARVWGLCRFLLLPRWPPTSRADSIGEMYHLIPPGKPVNSSRWARNGLC